MAELLKLDLQTIFWGNSKKLPHRHIRKKISVSNGGEATGDSASKILKLFFLVSNQTVNSSTKARP